MIGGLPAHRAAGARPPCRRPRADVGPIPYDGIVVLLLLALGPSAHAAGAGQTGASAGCDGCHDAAAGTVTATLSADASTVTPGGTVTLVLEIASSTGRHSVAGLDVAVTGGDLVAGSDTQLLSGELTHVSPVALGRTVRTTEFDFAWTAPTAEGTYVVSAAALAGDDDGTESGDDFGLASLSLTVDDGCDDADGDGWEGCDGDCDDTDAAVSPDGAETCDGVDQDCDGTVDDDATDALLWYADADGDGYGVVTDRVYACEAPAGYVAIDGDCDDADTAYNPGALEPDCSDPADYNCDGSTGYDDNDGDGWSACQDCNDGAAAVHPGATETCNTLDDDCDGDLDEDAAADARTWYDDQDGDGYGDPDDAEVDCDQPRGFVDNGEDCDDADDDAHPGATETWYDGVDQDCDGRDDDQDEDGYGVASDCDDLDADMYPGAPGDAWYDGVDTDCAGNSDYDADGDGYDSASYGGADCDDADAATYPGAVDDPDDEVTSDCDERDGDGDGYTNEAAGGEDCDDASSEIHPGATETWYDGVDQDCDGVDNDQDGDGVPFELDCDDTDPTVGNCYGEPDETPGPDERLYEPEAKDEACACGTGAEPTGLGLLAVAALIRRRRH